MSNPYALTEEGGVKVYTFSDAKQFLAHLSVNGPVFGGWTHAPESFLFRGHADSTWTLTPSAHRDLADPTKVTWNYNDLCNAEFSALIAFFQIADASGLAVPEDTQHLRTRVETRLMNTTEWPDPLWLSLLALAQHSGLRTRLLDWSRSPTIAAYFAASGAVEWDATRGERPRSLCVWGIEVEPIRADVGTKQIVHGMGNTNVRLVTAPPASNARLRAQRGCFTLVEPEKRNAGAEIDRRPLERILPASKMAKLVLDGKEADRLLYFLAREGVTAATVYPDYVGVIQHLKERERWRRDVPDAAAMSLLGDIFGLNLFGF